MKKGYETYLLLQAVITETNIWTAPPSGVTVKVKFHPHALNLKSKGKWVFCFIELPKGYKAGDVDFSTITLNGTIKGYVVNKAKECRVLIVKFDRKAVIDLVKQELLNIRKFGKVTLEITGKLVDDTLFSGTTTIKIIWKTQNHRYHVWPSKFTDFKQAEMLHTKIKEDNHSRHGDQPQSKQDNFHNINHKRPESVERVRNGKS